MTLVCRRVGSGGAKRIPLIIEEKVSVYLAGCFSVCLSVVRLLSLPHPAPHPSVRDSYRRFFIFNNIKDSTKKLTEIKTDTRQPGGKSVDSVQLLKWKWHND